MSQQETAATLTRHEGQGMGGWTPLRRCGRTQPKTAWWAEFPPGAGPTARQPGWVWRGSWPELSGVGPVSVGVGKHRALKGESLCICPCCLMQNVSKPVSRMLHTCPIQCLVLRSPYGSPSAPAALPCTPASCHSHDSPSHFNMQSRRSA